MDMQVSNETNHVETSNNDSNMQASSSSLCTSNSINTTTSSNSSIIECDEVQAPASIRKRHSLDLLQIFGDSSDAEHIGSGTESIRTRIDDEIRLYRGLKVPMVENYINFNLLNWWQTNELKFPILTRFSRFIHSIPATSAAAERSFSSAGYIYSERRSRMKPDTLSSMLTLQSNWDMVKSGENLINTINTNIL